MNASYILKGLAETGNEISFKDTSQEICCEFKAAFSLILSIGAEWLRKLRKHFHC